MAMEALPIFLDSLLPAWVSILISVTLILAFGEIIPQAVCSQYGLSVGAKLSVLVRLLVIIILPISYPISKILDCLLGKGHSALLRRSELKTFIDLHGNEAGRGGELTHDETTIIGGALELSAKTAKYAMTPLSGVFSLDINTKLDKNTLELITRKGHSRVPIYSDNPANIIGLILVKNLIACLLEDETPIRNLTIRKITRFYDNLPLYDVLNQFQKGHFHMGVVVKNERGTKSMPNETPKPDHLDAKLFTGGNYQHVTKEKKKTSRNPLVVHSTENSAYNLPTIDGSEMGESITFHYGDIDVMQPLDLDFFPDSNEVVIGIITMEDVMEELLQEEIYDETDDYVDVHNKIKINMMSSIRSSPRSSGATPTRVSYPSLRTPVPSPLSSYHNTPVMRSPLQPILLSSPTKSRLTSPMTSSPLRHVSRNSYEKLQHPDHSIV